MVYGLVGILRIVRIISIGISVCRNCTGAVKNNGSGSSFFVHLCVSGITLKEHTNLVIGFPSDAGFADGGLCIVLCNGESVLVAISLFLRLPEILFFVARIEGNCSCQSSN